MGGSICNMNNSNEKIGNLDFIKSNTNQPAITKNSSEEVMEDNEHQEKLKNFKEKICKIQTNWRFGKEKQLAISKIRIFDDNLSNEGKFISIKEMDSNITPAIQKIRSQNPYTIDQETPDENNSLICRKPFQYNLDNSIYQGFWNITTGIREGYGVELRDDGSLKEGIWKGSFKNGKIFNSDGSYYEGTVNNNQPHGIGKRINADGSIFSGLWSDGNHSMGERAFGDGHLFDGSTNNNLFHGEGSYTWPDKSVYRGSFYKSSLKGKGVYSSIIGDSYDGEWVNNQPHGKGIYIYARTEDGNQPKYEGMYYKGKKEGFGTFNHTVDISYEGQWKSGFPHGKGNLITKTKTFSGIWRYGRLSHLDDSSELKPEINISLETDKFKTTKADLLHLFQYQSILEEDKGITS